MSQAPKRPAFLRWARESLAPLSTVAPGPGWEDLAPLGRMIGDARVVALCEGEHLIAEPLQFRNRILEYLVKEKDFTAIAIESGSVESRVVHDYVRGGPGDPATVMAEGVSWTFDRLPQNQALVAWLRQYNADLRHLRKINFYGFDVPGSPGNPRVSRGMETALVEVLKYLHRVDSEAAAVFHARVGPLLASVRFDPYHSADTRGYERLDQTQRDRLTAAIFDLTALLERREAKYVEASSALDYEWAHRAAIGARQADGWLRQIPVHWEVTGEFGFLDVACDLRDRAQADNLEWIVKQEGPRGRVLVYAHNNHLSAATVKRSWWPLEHEDRRRQETAETTCIREVAGTYLRRRFGDRLVTIGNLIGQGSMGDSSFKRTLEQASAESLDGLAREMGVPLFLLDLRAAPPEMITWLDEERQLGRMYEVRKKRKICSELVASRAFDILFFVGTVTPACA